MTAALAAGLVLITAPAATADAPTITHLPTTDRLLLPAEEFCAGFDVQVDIQQTAKLIGFAGGGWMFVALGNGHITATLTNLSTGSTITRNISGPAFFDETGLPVLGTGAWFLYLPGDPGSILYLVGRMGFQPEPYGVSPTFVHGRTIDMCTLL
jgi:hypothetical protein